MGTAIAGITVLLLAAWLMTAAMGKSSAALRHVVWTCAIAATLLFAPLHRLAPRHTMTRPIPVTIAAAAVVVNSAAVGTGTLKAKRIGFGEIAFAIWGLGALLCAIRVAAGTRQFRRLIHDARASHRAFPVPVLISRGVPGPLVAGIFQPRIVLPEDSAEWSAARYRAVLAHELAHVRRRDPAILLLAQMATIVYWFHPLCWLAAARLRMESERACDDAALRIGLRPSGYAGELLDLARLFNPQPAIPMATTSHLESRVKSILDPLVNRSFATPRAWLTAAVITAALSAPLTVVSLRAQAPAGTGTITGTVMDPSGAVVPRAQVEATNSQGGNKEVATSDMVGNFTFNNVPAGKYTVEVYAPGFAVFHQDVTLFSGGKASAPVRLQVGHVIDKVSVVAPGSAQPTLSPATSASGPIRVGGNVQPTTLLFKADAVYPAALQAAGIEGTVLIEAVISKDGLPISLKPRNTAVDPAFISAAMDSARQWRWSPTMLNGEPIEALTTLQFDFKLQPK